MGTVRETKPLVQGAKREASWAQLLNLDLPSARPLSEYPLVLVEWIDASRVYDGWIDFKDVPEPTPHKCVSVGFLVSATAEGKILVPTMADIEHPENRLPTAAC